MNTAKVDVLDTVAAWRAEGREIALATVVHLQFAGLVGSQLAVEAGAMVGSVSGGCIEGAVTAAFEAIDNGQTQILEFGVSDEQAWEVGLACGGTVEVFVEPLSGA